MSEIGVVIIGRNEGERLVRCLESIGREYPAVYVDSGSTDGSVEAATRHGARVVELNLASPFTAARARNAGLAALEEQCTLVQFIDGDCILQPGWLDAAGAALNQDSGLAAASGRRREINPATSFYNWMCDLEWNVAPGPTRYFGGDVMLRRVALEQAGGYPAEMIAGEEPDLAIRLRQRNWRLICLQYEMTLHDASITCFAQWWRRSIRAGHAYAELAMRHDSREFSDYRRRMLGVLLWGGCIPLFSIMALIIAIVLRDGGLAIFTGIILFLPLIQLARIALRETVSHGSWRATHLALFLMLAKSAQMVGVARFWRGRLSGRKSGLIEYKGVSA